MKNWNILAFFICVDIKYLNDGAANRILVNAENRININKCPCLTFSSY